MCMTKTFRTTSLKSKRYDGCKRFGSSLVQWRARFHNLPVLGEKQFETVYTLSFVYGQKHVHEVELARGIAEGQGWSFM
jgi:hypothetical protein